MDLTANQYVPLPRLHGDVYVYVCLSLRVSAHLLDLAPANFENPQLLFLKQSRPIVHPVPGDS